MADKGGAGRTDLLALGLFLLGLVVSLAVFSAEHAVKLAVPSNNLLGPFGDSLAGELHQTLGSTVPVFLAAWFVLVIFLLMRKSWGTWGLRLSGWLMLLPCAAITADYLGPEWLSGPVVGSGGALGLAAWLT